MPTTPIRGPVLVKTGLNIDVHIPAISCIAVRIATTLTILLVKQRFKDAGFPFPEYDIETAVEFLEKYSDSMVFVPKGEKKLQLLFGLRAVEVYSVKLKILYTDYLQGFEPPVLPIGVVLGGLAPSTMYMDANRCFYLDDSDEPAKIGEEEQFIQHLVENFECE